MFTATWQRAFVLVQLCALAASVIDGAPGFAQERTEDNAKYKERQAAKVDTWKIKQPAEARECALRSGGLRADVVSSAKLVTVQDDQTPFLGDKLNGRELWIVTVSNWSLELRSAPGAKDTYQRTLDILIDPVTGHMLKMKTHWTENGAEPQDTIEPDAGTAEQQILPEIYHGFPSEPPPISFMEALEASGPWGSRALYAKQIEALWVLWSAMGSDPRPVWVITLWCIPPIPVFHGEEADVPVYFRETVRFLVDPIKKDWIRASHSPHRVPVEKGKP